MAKMSISACSSPYLAPLAASARPYSSSCVFARHPVASFDQIRRGCCPPPAWLLPLACGCWKPPLHRGSQQLPLLSCFRRYTEPPFSSSLAPLRAAAHLFAGRLKDPIASTAAHDHPLAERSSNASGSRPASVLGLGHAEAPVYARTSDRKPAGDNAPFEALRKGAGGAFKCQCHIVRN